MGQIRMCPGAATPETKFRGATYCHGHGDLGNRRRKKLRDAIREIDSYINDPRRAASTGEGPEGTLTKSDLTQWRRRLQWELDGIPNA